MTRRFGMVAVLAAALVGAALAFALRAEIAERLLRHALEDTPLAGASYRVAEIGLTRAVIHDIRLAAGGSVARATVAYRPATLLRGQGQRLTLAGARLDLTELPWAELPRAELPRAAPWPPLPFPVLALEDLQASIATPWGPAILRLDAVLRPDRKTGSGRWRLDGPDGLAGAIGAAGTLELAPVAASAPELRATFTVQRGLLAHPRLRAGPLTGRVALDWAPGAPAPALLRVALEAGQASWDRRALGPAAVELRWDGRALEGEIAFGGEGAPFAARLALAGRYDEPRDGPRDELGGGRWLVEADGEASARQDVEIARLAIAAPARLTFQAAGPLAALAEGEFSALAATARLDAAGLALGDAVAAHGATLALAVAGGRDDRPAAAQLQAGFAHLTLGGAAGGAVLDHAALDLPLTLAGRDGRMLARAGPGALLRAERLALAGLTLQGLLAELPLAFERDGRRLYLRLTETAWLDIEGLAHPRLRTLEPFSLELVAEHLPLLVLERLAGEWSWDARVNTGATAAAFELLVGDLAGGLAGGAAPTGVAGLLPRIALRLGSLGLNHLQGTMEARGGDLVIAGPDVRLGGLAVLASYNSGLSPWPQVEATAATLEDLRRPARFAPASADAALRPAWPRGGDARMEANLHMAGIGKGGRYLANVEGHWRAEDGRLRALVRLPALTFQAGGAQPVDLSPRYGASIDEAEGGFELRGELVRENGSWRQAWRLLLLDLTARAGAIAVEGLEGEIALTAIAPATTMTTIATGATVTAGAGHRLTARRLALGGVTLTDIAADLALPGDGSLDVKGAGASFAGGRLALAPTRIAPGAAAGALTLEAQGMELAELLARFPVAGLTGAGRIGGRLALTFSPAGVAIEGARLAAEAPGRLRYLPPGPAAARPAPLSDFRFTALELALERPPGGPATARARIAGATVQSSMAAFHGGAPLRFDLRPAIEATVRRALAAADAILPRITNW